ncbi:MAG: hypothetical protein ACRDJM_10655, partial [Actinomycetota bacterium]
MILTLVFAAACVALLIRYRGRGLGGAGMVAVGGLILFMVAGSVGPEGLWIMPAVLAALLWYVGRRSEREGTTAGARRAVSDAAFFTFFALFTGSVLVWLIGGLVPGVARAIPALHASLHDWGGGDAGTLRLRGRTAGCGSEPMEIREGREPTIEFTNTTTVDLRVSIYAEDPHVVLSLSSVPDSDLRTVFESTKLAGPASRTYTVFNGLRPGRYSYACGGTTAGSLTVIAAPRETGVFPTIARRIANASHGGMPAPVAAVEYLFGALSLGFGLFILRRRPRDRTARLLSLGLIGTAAVFNLQAHTIFGITGRGNWLAIHDMFHMVSGVAFAFAVIVFPDGRIVPRLSGWKIWPLRAGYAFATFVVM